MGICVTGYNIYSSFIGFLFSFIFSQTFFDMLDVKKKGGKEREKGQLWKNMARINLEILL